MRAAGRCVPAPGQALLPCTFVRPCPTPGKCPGSAAPTHVTAHDRPHHSERPGPTGGTMGIIIIVALGTALLMATMRVSDLARTKRPVVANVPVHTSTPDVAIRLQVHASAR